MRKNLFLALIMSLIFSSTFANANEACLLETSSTMMGMKLEIKDCMQNAGMLKGNFKSQCQGISQAAVSMGGPAAKITYLTSCPTPFQAKCDNTKTAKTVSFYYKRAANEAAGLKSSCELMKGIYTKGTL